MNKSNLPGIPVLNEEEFNFLKFIDSNPGNSNTSLMHLTGWASSRIYKNLSRFKCLKIIDEKIITNSTVDGELKKFNKIYSINNRGKMALYFYREKFIKIDRQERKIENCV